VFERYFLGGITDIRGFAIQSIGPRLGSPRTYDDPSFMYLFDRGTAIGGNMQFYYNPLATRPCDVDLLRLRTSLGFGVRWFSPLGPLRFEWGFPINPRRPYEDTVEFQFTVGNAF
jgi:outer membrane protein insertion porin family